MSKYVKPKTADDDSNRLPRNGAGKLSSEITLPKLITVFSHYLMKKQHMMTLFGMNVSLKVFIFRSTKNWFDNSSIDDILLRLIPTNYGRYTHHVTGQVGSLWHRQVYPGLWRQGSLRRRRPVPSPLRFLHCVEDRGERECELMIKVESATTLRAGDKSNVWRW